MSTKRRHYRVAQRQVEQAPSKGTFVTKKKEHKIAAFMILMLCLIFVKGILIGHMIARRQA